MENIGETIRRIRCDKGMTQEELAKTLGTTRGAVSRYEQGSREPRLAQLQIIADALGVSVQQLTGKDNLDVQFQACAADKKEARRQRKIAGEMAAALDLLSDKGQTEAVRRIREMSALPQYQKTPEGSAWTDILSQQAVGYVVAGEYTEVETFPSDAPFGGPDIVVKSTHIIMAPAAAPEGRPRHFWCYASPLEDAALEGIVSLHDPENTRKQVSLVFTDSVSYHKADSILTQRHFDDDISPALSLLLIGVVKESGHVPDGPEPPADNG